MAIRPVPRRRRLDGAAWDRYVQNANRLGRMMKEDYGLLMVLHPHGDSHIETREDIDRIFQATDPEYVGFCLDTGHIVYGMGDVNDLIRSYLDRISYVHIKAMDPTLVQQAHDEDWPFVIDTMRWLLAEEFTTMGRCPSACSAGKSTRTRSTSACGSASSRSFPRDSPIPRPTMTRGTLG